MLTREQGLALSGQNNHKEAKGLALVKDILKTDGRLCFRKSAESARADFCVWLPGQEDHALGVQLKTAHAVNTNCNCPQFKYVQFAHTDGYAGLLILCVAFIEPARFWIFVGSDVTSKALHVPLVDTTRKRKRDWGAAEVQREGLAQLLLDSLEPHPELILHSVSVHVKPTHPERVIEYEAHEWLCRHMQAEFIEPEVEHRPYDYVVNGERWQMKVAGYEKRRDRFTVSLKKSAGRTSGKHAWCQYDAGDFDRLCILLPVGDAHLQEVSARIYLIPMQMLISRSLIGREKSSAAVFLYPHRTAAGDAKWAEAYVLHLSDSNDIAKVPGV